MKTVRIVVVVCAMIGSLGLPIFFLAVRHFHLEEETAQWLVSLWPRSQGSVPLEDRRAMADMVVTYGELAGASMLACTAFAWCGMFVYSRVKRAVARE
jgi:hypothetical protein